ncbi:GDYXXLXY domain-containing protein [Microbulbifer halophilus]
MKGMMKRILKPGLAVAIAFQFLILTGMYVAAQMPLWSGEEIHLKTIPVDPRSLFRGNYARLEYEISQVSAEHFPEGASLRRGEVVYISLEPGREGLHELAGAGLEKPDEGLFLRGRVTGSWLGGARDNYHIDYGIEAFFAPKEKALELESDLRNGGVAEVMVSGGGRARLKDVIPAGAE